MLRWETAFEQFAASMCDSMRDSNDVQLNEQEQWADVELLTMFLTHVADENKGVSRVTAARRVLNNKRLRLGLPSLNDVPAISMLVDGVWRSQPHTPHQVESLDVNDVRTVGRALATQADWCLRMIGVMLQVGFLTLARSDELVRFRRAGVWLILHNGTQRNLASERQLPDASTVQGILLHVPWRKAAQSSNGFLPCDCPATIVALL